LNLFGSELFSSYRKVAVIFIVRHMKMKRTAKKKTTRKMMADAQTSPEHVPQTAAGPVTLAIQEQLRYCCKTFKKMLNGTKSSSLAFNVVKRQSIKDHTLFTAVMQFLTVSSCQTPPLTCISIMSSSSLTKSKPFQVNLHTLDPRLSTFTLTLWPLNP